MKLKDIANMEKYLEEDCYCPGEIYDISGFFYIVFDAEEECQFVTKGKLGKSTAVVVICRDQLITFVVNDNNEIVNAERCDATENNIQQITDYLNGKIEKIRLNEFNEGETVKNLTDIMQLADFIMID